MAILDKKPTLFIAFLVALLLRLYHVGLPIGGWGTDRQAESVSMAKMFLESGCDPFVPHIGTAAAVSGVTGPGLPVFPYMAAVLYRIFGEHVFIGRILSICFSLMTMLGLYLLVKESAGKDTAVVALFVYAILPVNAYYGRAFAPDALAMMCAVFGLFSFSRWINTDRLLPGLIAGLCISLCVLIDLRLLVICIPLAGLAWEGCLKQRFSRWKLLLFLWCAALLIVPWYVHTCQHVQSSGFSGGIPIPQHGQAWMNLDLLLGREFYYHVFWQSVVTRQLTYVGAVLLLVGLLMRRHRGGEKLFHAWLLAGVVAILVFAPGNIADDSVQLFLVPPAAVIIAKVVTALLDRAAADQPFFIRKIFLYLLALDLVLALGVMSVREYNSISRLDAHKSMKFIREEGKGLPQ